MVSHLKYSTGSGKHVETTTNYHGWLTSGPNLLNPPQPQGPNFVQYYYFEKDIELAGKNYVGWCEGDMWLDAGKCCDIDVHPFKDGEKFRND